MICVEGDIMSLVKCPECGRKISNKATRCPDCGSFIKDKFNRKKKRKRNMNLIINIILATILIVSFSGNIILGFEVYKAKEEIAIVKKENDNLIRENEKSKIIDNKSEINDINNELNEDSNIGDDIYREEQDKPNAEKQQISLNERVFISTSYGDFNLTVEHVKRTDWLERSGDESSSEFQAVVIECDIQNISYEDPYNNIFWLNHHLNIFDDTNYVVDDLNFSYDDGEYLGNIEIPIGTNAKILEGYKVKNGVQSLKITINEQYELNVMVE